MDSEVKIFGKIRGLNTDILYRTNDEETSVELTPQGEQLTDQSAAPYSEISRQGKSFWINTAAAVASVISTPTTTCAFALYNNEPDGGRSYVMTQVWALFVANASILPQAVIIACLGQVREAIPTNAMSATVLLKSFNGSPKFDTRARVILTATALPATTGFAGQWFPIVDSANAAVAALPGFQRVFNVEGRYIVPPGRYFAVHCLSAKTDVTAQYGFAWTEKYLNLG